MLSIRRAVTPSGNCVQLPRYPWQRRRFWLDAPAAINAVPLGNTLLGKRIEASTEPGTFFWETELQSRVPRLGWQTIACRGEAVLPGAAASRYGHSPQLPRYSVKARACWSV
jgi:polyketide synthase 12/epothilone polyketide synthase D